MFTTTAVITILLALLLMASAGGKLVQAEAQMKTLRGVGVPEETVPLLAAAEIAGGIGLVMGLVFWPLGLAAGLGVVGYFIGAVWSHLRQREWSAPAAVLLVMATSTLVLRIWTI
jgi:hypothetical protein